MKFEPELICAVLVEEGVQFVLVGGLAAVLHGSPLPTVDIDVVPKRASENFEQAVIDSKTAADRAKDHRALPYLESLRDEIQRNE